VSLENSQVEVQPLPLAEEGSAKPAHPRVRETEFRDYTQIAALESHYGLHPKRREEWTDLWVRNPLYRKISHWPLGWVCEDGDHQIVGSVANIPLLYELGDRTLIAATSRALVMDSTYRAYSFSLLSRFFNQKNVNLFINTTVNAKAEKLQEVFRASHVPAGAWDRSAFWITNYRAFTASLLTRKKMPGATILSYPLSAALFARDTVNKALWAQGDRIEVEFCKQFDCRFDTFFDRLRKSYPCRLLASRSSSLLDWHFKHAFSANRVWVLTVSRGQELSAYAILCRQDNPELGLERMRLVDVQTLPGHEGLLRPMLLRALKRCQDEGTHMLEAIGFSFEKQRLIESMSPHYRELASWRYFYKANDPDLAACLKDPQAWDPTCFDGDSSL